MTRKIYLQRRDRTMECMGFVRNDRRVGDLLQPKGCDEPMRVMRHIHGDLVVIPASQVPDDKTCDGCVDARKSHGSTLGPYCLACRRMYWPNTDAFANKGDFFSPDGDTSQ